MNSRVVQEEYSKIDCPTADMASVFSGRTKQGSEVHTIQKPERVDFHTEFISGPAIEHSHFYDRKKVNLTRQLSFVPFDKSGIYSEEYLKKRRETMFRTVKEKTVGKGVVRTFAPVHAETLPVSGGSSETEETDQGRGPGGGGREGGPGGRERRTGPCMVMLLQPTMMIGCSQSKCETTKSVTWSDADQFD